MDLKYRRVLLKVSGQALLGDSHFGIDPKVLGYKADEIREIVSHGCEVGLVVGGGNFFRGRDLTKAGINRVTGDHMGMMSTIMNALAMRDVFERHGVETRVMSALPIPSVIEPFDLRKAQRHMRLGRVIIFAGGTGNPLVTTDSAASLRAIEIEADALFKLTRVNGVYSADPELDPSAKHFGHISYKDVIENDYKVMDMVAFYQCWEHKIPICVFNVFKKGALAMAVQGHHVGTLVSEVS